MSNRIFIKSDGTPQKTQITNSKGDAIGGTVTRMLWGIESPNHPATVRIEFRLPYVEIEGKVVGLEAQGGRSIRRVEFTDGTVLEVAPDDDAEGKKEPAAT